MAALRPKTYSRPDAGFFQWFIETYIDNGIQAYPGHIITERVLMNTDNSYVQRKWWCIDNPFSCFFTTGSGQEQYREKVSNMKIS